MKKITLILGSLLIASSSAYAATPAERSAAVDDSYGLRIIRQDIHQDRQEIHDIRKDIREDKHEMRKKCKHHHRQHMKSHRKAHKKAAKSK